LGVITREDTGEMQVTYNHMPLYYWVNDAAAGDATGQGVGDVWYVVKPELVVAGGNDELGTFLTDAAGMTLYIFTVDEPGMSACTDSCLDNWPPLTVDSEDELVAGIGVPGELGVFERADNGDLQVTYNDMALYYWVSDAEPGDATGQGVGDVWYVVAPALVTVGGNDDLGEFLTDAEGMTLYIRTSDEPGMSLCTGGCLENWPALTVTSENELVLGEGVEGELGVITREDTGEMQVTLNDMPLYYWVNDAVPGDATGQGVGEVWYVLTPAGEVMQ
jgi:predicted lipoprotein with Yx(FWY)xxD motif